MAKGKDKRLRTIPKNLPIIREAESTKAICFLVKGRAAVMVDGREVHEIRPGDFFGEIASILDVPRTATVLTKDTCEVYEFQGMEDGELYQFLRDRPPNVLEAFVKGLAGKLVASSRTQGTKIREQDSELQRMRKAVAGTIALVAKVLEKVGDGNLRGDYVLHDIATHLKKVAGVDKGDIREIDPKALPYLRDFLFPPKISP